MSSVTIKKLRLMIFYSQKMQYSFRNYMRYVRLFVEKKLQKFFKSLIFSKLHFAIVGLSYNHD
jgi:hypothetical protein